MTGILDEPNRSELLIYQTDDGKTHIEVCLENETVWLSQSQLCELFAKNKRTISEHIRNIFKEGELKEDAVVRKFRTTAADGKNYSVPEVIVRQSHSNRHSTIVNIQSQGYPR